MFESKAMLEIRKIRDENSERHLQMTDEEILREYEETTKWFVGEMEKRGKEVKIVTVGAETTKSA